MKKIIFILVFAMFSVSMSAHENTKLQQKIATETLLIQNHQFASASYYTGGNGGIIQVIYNIFFNVGKAISSTINEEENQEETTTGDQ